MKTTTEAVGFGIIDSKLAAPVRCSHYTPSPKPEDVIDFEAYDCPNVDCPNCGETVPADTVEACEEAGGEKVCPCCRDYEITRFEERVPERGDEGLDYDDIYGKSGIDY